MQISVVFKQIYCLQNISDSIFLFCEILLVANQVWTIDILVYLKIQPSEHCRFKDIFILCRLLTQILMTIKVSQVFLARLLDVMLLASIPQELSRTLFLKMYLRKHKISTVISPVNLRFFTLLKVCLNQIWTSAK